MVTDTITAIAIYLAAATAFAAIAYYLHWDRK